MTCLSSNLARWRGESHLAPSLYSAVINRYGFGCFPICKQCPFATYQGLNVPGFPDDAEPLAELGNYSRHGVGHDSTAFRAQVRAEIAHITMGLQALPKLAARGVIAPEPEFDVSCSQHFIAAEAGFEELPAYIDEPMVCQACDCDGVGVRINDF